MLCRRDARIQRASQQADSRMKNIKSTKGYLKTE